jgi:hypothetical protein
MLTPSEIDWLKQDAENSAQVALDEIKKHRADLFQQAA